MSDLRFEFEVRGLEKLRQAGSRFDQAFQEAGRETMARASADLQNRTVQRFQHPARNLPPAINTGLLRGSVAPRTPRVEGRTIEGGIATNVSYALPVEAGSRPHWPPRAPIEFWVRRKLRVPGPQVKGVAFLVARKIARRGTQARRIFALGLEDARPRMTEIFRRLPGLIVRRMAEGT